MNRVRICLTPHHHYTGLGKFINTLFAGVLHGHTRKTLLLMTRALLEVKRMVLSELARELPVPIRFNSRLRRLWRFGARTVFDYRAPAAALAVWLLTAVRDRRYLAIIIDWTKIRRDYLLVFSLPYRRRAVPLYWAVVGPADYEQNAVERRLVRQFLAVVPAALRSKLVFIGDRGFGKSEWLRWLGTQGVGYVMRVKGKVWLATSAYQGWLSRYPLRAGQTRWLPDVTYHRAYRLGLNLLLKHEPADPVYLATNLTEADTVLALYAQRMTIEEGFRDIKHGLGFGRLRVADAERVGKLLLVGVLAYLFIILLGMAVIRRRRLWDAIINPRCKSLLSVFRLGLFYMGRATAPPYRIALEPD